MTEKEFERLLLQPESTTLDFKREPYDFSNDNDNRKISEFIKDVISFSNTIRNETSYIIIGVGIESDGSKNLIGLHSHIDDAILQEKIKNKVHPIPRFSYYTFKYKNTIFGIIEIPVSKYETPISATIKLKGIEPGKFYFRRGSSNSEANGFESINISRWLDSLPELNNQETLFNRVSEIISKLTKQNSRLSDCISDALKLAVKYNLEQLKYFCANELSGWGKKLTQEEIQTTFAYRTNKVIFTPHKIQLPQYLSWDSSRMIHELKQMEDVYENQMFFSQSIIDIEEILERLSKSNSILYSVELPASNFIDNEKFSNLTMTVYGNKDNFDNIHKNIRQKLIDNLLNIQ